MWYPNPLGKQVGTPTPKPVQLAVGYVRSPDPLAVYFFLEFGCLCVVFLLKKILTQGSQKSGQYIKVSYQMDHPAVFLQCWNAFNGHHFSHVFDRVFFFPRQWQNGSGSSRSESGHQSDKFEGSLGGEGEASPKEGTHTHPELE